MNNLDDARRKSRELWQSMAPSWERHRDFLYESTAEMTEWMIQKLAPEPGEVILDLAAGAGDVGLRFAGGLRPNGKLISSDFAPDMVEAAARVANELGLDNVETVVLDAEKNTFPDASVDGVICRWGFMLMQDPQTALGETRRVLRDGGRLVFSVMAAPDQNPWGSVPVKALVDMSFVPPPKPDAPGALFSLADESRLVRMVSDAGFQQVEVTEQPFHFQFRDFDHFWWFLTEWAGAVAQLINALPEDRRKEAAGEIKNRIERFATGEGYDLPGKSLGVVAR